MKAKQLSRALLLVALVSAACSRPSRGTVERVTDAAAENTASAPASEPVKAKPTGKPQPRLPMGTVDLLPHEGTPIHLRVEIASKDTERQMGLMFREHLANDEGMLFIFPTERYNSFWMHNTLIPLDMFFIDSEWNVVGIVENATPLTDDPRGVGHMSQYVLEVNAGFAARHRLSAGAKVKFVAPPMLELP